MPFYGYCNKSENTHTVTLSELHEVCLNNLKLNIMLLLQVLNENSCGYMMDVAGKYIWGVAVKNICGQKYVNKNCAKKLFEQQLCENNV